MRGIKFVDPYHRPKKALKKPLSAAEKRTILKMVGARVGKSARDLHCHVKTLEMLVARDLAFLSRRPMAAFYSYEFFKSDLGYKLTPKGKAVAKSLRA